MKLSFLPLMLTGISAASLLRSEAPSTTLRLYTYFTNWNVYPQNENYQSSQIPDSVTGATYAFAQVGNCAFPYSADTCNSGPYATGVQDYKLYSTDPYSDFYTVPNGYNLAGTSGLGNMGKFIAQMHKSNRPAILSGGGFTATPPFMTAMTAEYRDTYVQSVVDFLNTVKKDAGATFDGYSTDIEPDNAQWTFLDNADAATTLNNILTTAHQMKTTLQAAFGTSFLLTAAWPASPDVINKAESVLPGFWKAWLDALNTVDVMTYDYHGDFDSPAISNFNAPAQYDPAQPANVANRANFNVESTLSAYQSVLTTDNMAKLNLGLPVYGRGLAGVEKGSEVCPGVYQPFTGMWTSNANADAQQGMFTYDYITLMIKSGELTACYDAAAGQYVGYNEEERHWVTFDNSTSVSPKIDLIDAYGLGGAFFWESSYDQKGTYADEVAAQLNSFPDEDDHNCDCEEEKTSGVTSRDVIGGAVGFMAGIAATFFAMKLCSNPKNEQYEPLLRNAH